MEPLIYQEEMSLDLPSTPEIEQAAARLTAAFLEGVDVPEAAAPESAVATPPLAPSAPAIPQAPVVDDGPAPFDFTTFEPNLSPDLASLLEDEPPDFEAEARAEVAAELQAAEDTGTYYDAADPDLTAQLRAAQKRNEFLESRLVETNKGKWLAENLRAYPLVAQYAKDELEAIQATSRRGFARDAAKVNDRITRIAKPLLDDLQARLAATGEQVTADRRAQVDASWGKPAIDQAATGASSDLLARQQRAIRSGDLGATIQTMIEAGDKVL